MLERAFTKGPLSGPATALAIILLTGCAGTGRSPDSAGYQDPGQYAQRFKVTRSHCNAQGGRMIIAASQRPGRDGVPARGDYYFCSRSR